jgi:hypothetical protein
MGKECAKANAFSQGSYVVESATLLSLDGRSMRIKYVQLVSAELLVFRTIVCAIMHAFKLVYDLRYCCTISLSSTAACAATESCAAANM